MLLFSYAKSELTTKAAGMNFIRDTLEKVLRLTDILEYLNKNPVTCETLALKGGTAINLTVFNLPRLSVDIDLDYSRHCLREQMLEEREEITNEIKKYMTSQNYILSDKSKYRHSLDSFVFVYKNLGGMNDNIKIEINYSLRSHIFELQRRKLTYPIRSKFEVLTVAPYEMFSGKINALLSRAAARDLYDVYNLIKFQIFNKTEYDILRKSIVFYTAISQDIISLDYSTNIINGITKQKIKTDLLPVIKKGERVELEEMKNLVSVFINDLMALTDNEKKFLFEFSNKKFMPELVFDDVDILNRIKKHPMALWKMIDHDV